MQDINRHGLAGHWHSSSGGRFQASTSREAATSLEDSGHHPWPRSRRRRTNVLPYYLYQRILSCLVLLWCDVMYVPAQCNNSTISLVLTAVAIPLMNIYRTIDSSDMFLIAAGTHLFSSFLWQGVSYSTTIYCWNIHIHTYLSFTPIHLLISIITPSRRINN
jgi:hypothetical protein